MNHSYLYTKRFLDRQVKKLDQPLVVNDNLQKILAQQRQSGEESREDGDDDEDDEDEDEDSSDLGEMNDKMLMKIVQRMNLIIKKKNRKLFSGQVTNQVAQQIIKLEQNNLLKINEQLAKVNSLLEPIILPAYQTITGISKSAKLNQFDRLISQLPSSKYLIVNNDDDDDDDDDDDENREGGSEQKAGSEVEAEAEGRDRVDNNQGVSEEDNQEKGSRNFQGLGQDDENEAKKSKKRNRKNGNSLMKFTANQQLLREYDEIRTKLIDLNKKLIYDCHKLQYLSDLNTKIHNLLPIDKSQPQNDKDFDLYDSDEEIGNTNRTTIRLSQPDLQSELNKFMILMKKLDYKLQDQNFRELITNLNK